MMSQSRYSSVQGNAWPRRMGSRSPSNGMAAAQQWHLQATVHLFAAQQLQHGSGTCKQRCTCLLHSSCSTALTPGPPPPPALTAAPLLLTARLGR
jgi:hypothetical protein